MKFKIASNMKSKILNIKYIIVIILITNTLSIKAQSEDEKAVKAIALDYIEGWYEADTVRMANALSPELIKRGFLISHKTNKLVKREANYSKMLEWTGKKINELKDNPNLQIEVEVIEVGKNIAMVKTTSPHFIDFLHLGRFDGKWKIYNAIWEMNAK